ncbi:transmembrane gamma-carboxyglutamic acid protein 1-like [Salmo trutta]|uniref:transmembrane gamma-carboxyglutamic acid protein 1-like n=1 Tax=Salmo trutta TaxID=8032 RepID=UPI0011316241|nr:transmembrane gamma-carboxyglutamic acid protein 1-like [Salmo trutta]
MRSVFLPSDLANTVLRRLRRDNGYLLEEIRQGNIQRECREEICTYEEAREAFENDEKTQQFWEEYVRESSGGQQLEGRVHSLYLILPLLLVLLISGVAITVWRCHSRKRSERNPALGHSHRDPTLSLISMDQLSVNSSPADPGSEVTSTRGGRGDPPPSYEEVVGHTDVHIETEPPPYEDIIGHGK